MTEENKTEKKESWWTDARKVLRGQILTLLLTPASVAITIYLTEYYKAPKPRIEFASVKVATKKLIDAPSTSIRTKIIKDPYLAEFIWKEPILMNSNASKNWLNGGDWNKECETTFETLILSYKKKLRNDNYDLRWNKTESQQNPGSFYYDNSENSNTVLSIINDFSNELVKIKKSNAIRTGEVELKIGVLNRGASDGVIYRDAILKFENEKMKVTAENYVAIKAHSFSEITLSTRTDFLKNANDSIKILSNEMTADKKFADLVRKGETIPFELTLTVSDKTASVEDTIPTN